MKTTTQQTSTPTEKILEGDIKNLELDKEQLEIKIEQLEYKLESKKYINKFLRKRNKRLFKGKKFYRVLSEELKSQLVRNKMKELFTQYDKSNNNNNPK